MDHAVTWYAISTEMYEWKETGDHLKLSQWKKNTKKKSLVWNFFWVRATKWIVFFDTCALSCVHIEKHVLLLWRQIWNINYEKKGYNENSTMSLFYYNSNNKWWANKIKKIFAESDWRFVLFCPFQVREKDKVSVNGTFYCFTSSRRHRI